MATITKRGQSWSVQIRRQGAPSQFKSFRTKAEAKAWAVQQEAKIERGDLPPPMRLLRSTTLGEIVDRYLREVTPRKRGADSERLRLQKLRRDPICEISLATLNTAYIAEYRNRREKEVKPATIARELALLHHMLETAQSQWGFRLPTNPVACRIAIDNARDRRLAPGELKRLDASLAASKPLLARIVHFALESAMRRGEILNLRWKHVDLEQRTAHIPETKTGKPRTIPLTDGGVAILRSQLGCDTAFVFPMSGNAVRLAWTRAVKRAGLIDLHFHDLRHEAISRFFELGLSVAEVMIISGHRDPRMLFRYTHLRPVDLAQKLVGRQWAPTVVQGEPEPVAMAA